MQTLTRNKFSRATQSAIKTAVVVVLFGASGLVRAENTSDFSPLTSQASYYYSVRVISQNLTQCQEMAASLGANFKTYTGLTVVAANCSLVNDGKSADLVVTYLSEFSAPVHANWFGTDPSPIETRNPAYRQPSIGLYSNAQACQADLAAKVSQFQQETKQQVVDAFCSYATVQGVALRIDAIGQAKKKLRALTIDGRGKVVPGFVAQLQAAVAAHTGATVSASIANDYRVDVFYYSAEPVALRVVRNMGGALRTKQDCEAQAAAAAEILKADGAKTYVFGCLADTLASTTPYYFANLIVEGQTLDVVLGTQQGPKYGYFADCMADRERVLELYRSQGVFNGIGALCGIDFLEDQQSYKMTLYNLHHWERQ